MIVMRERARIDAAEIKGRLTDPVGACTALGFPVSRPTAHDCFIALRAEDSSPSTHVYRGPRDGTLLWKDFGSNESGDVFKLIAVARGLDVRTDYQRVLEIAADLAGSPALLKPVVQKWVASASASEFPDRVADFWHLCTPVTEDEDASAVLAGRGLSPTEVADADYARAMPRTMKDRPDWARFASHRLIVPMVDCDGVMRSVRGWRTWGTGDPKRIPPRGHRAAGLVMANEAGIRLLKKNPDEWERLPRTLVILEGEPDALGWFIALRREETKNVAAWGIVNGSWTPDFAARIPDGTRVAIRTHLDAAGDSYANAVNDSLKGRCEVHRSYAPGEAP